MPSSAAAARATVDDMKGLKTTTSAHAASRAGAACPQAPPGPRPHMQASALVVGSPFPLHPRETHTSAPPAPRPRLEPSAVSSSRLQHIGLPRLREPQTLACLSRSPQRRPRKNHRPSHACEELSLIFRFFGIMPPRLPAGFPNRSTAVASATGTTGAC
jgi:hypothetical protein